MGGAWSFVQFSWERKAVAMSVSDVKGIHSGLIELACRVAVAK